MPVPGAVPMSGDSSEAKEFVIVADARRRWTRAQKQAIVAECGVGTASVSAIARKHNIAPNLLFRWRKDFGRGQRVGPEKPAAFVPVALPALPISSASRDVTMPAARNGLIDIELAGGHRLRLEGPVDAGLLRQVIEVLQGR
jgi:transposase